MCPILGSILPIWAVIVSAIMVVVMFEWNVQLDLSGEAVTKSFGPLMTKLLLKVLC